MSTPKFEEDPKVQEYRDAHYAVRTAAIILAAHDLEELIADINRADGIGPILDPTLWRNKHDLMHQDKELFEAALSLWKLGRQMLNMDRPEPEEKD